MGELLRVLQARLIIFYDAFILNLMTAFPINLDIFEFKGLDLLPLIVEERANFYIKILVHEASEGTAESLIPPVGTG